MRILLLTQYYAPEVGAPQLRWSALVREFRVLGHDVQVLAPPPHYPLGCLLPGTAWDITRVGSTTAGAHGETVHRVAWRPTSTSTWSTLVDQMVAAGHSVLVGWRRRHQIAPDVVIATAPALPSVAAGWALSRLLGRPLVLEMRDAWPELATDALTADTSPRQRVRAYAVQLAAVGVRVLQTRADLVVSTTASFAEVLGRRGVRRVTVVRNAHHPLPGVAAIEPRDRSASPSLHIVYVGTVGRAQDLETAVRAVARVVAEGLDARLRVVGTGARLPSVMSLARELDVPVQFVGPVSRSEVAEHYRWADTLLVSLRSWPGLAWAVPSKLYEALGLGLHVSGVVTGEARKIVADTGAGFTVAPGRDWALAHKWRQLAEEGPQPRRDTMQAWVQQHASEAGTAAAYLDELRQVVAARAESPPPHGLRLLAQRTRHLAAAAATGGSMARDDLAWLTVQAGRRLPSGLRSRLGRWATRGVTGVLGVWGELLLDRPERARQRLAELGAHGSLAGTLAVHAGTAPAPSAPDAHRARWAWLVGNLDEAADLARNGQVNPRLRGKVLGDIEALTGGPRPLPAASRWWEAGPQPRVLHVLTNSLPHTRSGYTLRTHAILTAQRDAGIAVTAMTRPAYPVSIGKVLARGVDVVDDISYHRCVPPGLPPGEAQRVDVWAQHLVQLAERHRVTHLHSTTHYPNALAAQAAARALGLPWVHEVRGQLERTWASGRARNGDRDPLRSQRYLAWREREAELAAQADHVITLSQTMKTDLAARGVDPDRITVVANGIEPALLERDVEPAAARGALGLPTDGLWVGAVTSVVHYEGMEDLVDAVAIARGRGLDVRAAIVGDGLAWPALQRRVVDLGLEDVVHLPGRLPRDQALAWLDALDVVVIPRRDFEVTQLVPPLKLSEAMGAGKPTIASDLPVLSETVSEARCGVLLPPDDPRAMADAFVVMSDGEQRRRAAAQAREAARALTWDAQTQTLAEVYGQTAAERRSVTGRP